MGIRSKLRKLWKMDIPKFIYYNFIAKNVKRDKGCWIFPIKGTCIDMARSASIELHGNITLNHAKLKGSKAECLLLLQDNAKLTVNKSLTLYCDARMSVHKDAALTIGSLRANNGTIIACEYKITIGNRVRMGNNVFILDSDYHPILNDEGKRINSHKEVIIEDDVWLASKATVLKGATIHAGTVIGANSLVSGNVPGGVIVTTMPARPVMKVDYNGSRPN